MTQPVSNKTSLRKNLRQKRRSLSVLQQSIAAHGLLTQLQTLSAFQQANKVAMYLTNDGEIDPAHAMRWLQQQGRHCYVPFVQQHDGRNTMLFAEVTDDTTFVDNHFGIAEPRVDHADMIEARDLDLVLLPLVGFDNDGNRVGMGGGFYDTTFEFVSAEKLTRPAMIGIAHEVQRVERINAEKWDIPLSTVVTDQHVYRQ